MGRLAVMWTMLRGQPATGSLSERLDAFYRPQARAYDRTREGLLKGRRELVERLEIPAGGTLVDLGGGTGRSLEFLGDRMGRLGSVYLVDLCRPLLDEARQRGERLGWTQLHTVNADSTVWRPPHPVDCVHISYSLSMVPSWFQVIDNALAMLKPGGLLGVVDFYVSRKVPAAGRVRHGWFTRTFWPLWFEHDGVFLSRDHLPYLCDRPDRLAPVELIEGRSRVLGIPYYVFVGRKPAA
jgi:S-adenosylmethionine-diacylgycerolhomoserine-N-methlytransferase